MHHTARLSPPGFVDLISRKQLLLMQLNEPRGQKQKRGKSAQ